MELLGRILVQARAVSPHGVEQALAAQVIHGGRIGTNLVELSLCSEGQVATALGRQHGVASAFGELVPEAEALKLVPAGYCDDKDVLPYRIEGKKLHVLVINPGDIAAADHVATITGMRVTPAVVPEFRMAQLQRRWCRAFRSMRAIDVMEAAPRAQEADRGPAQELMSEEEFQALYAKAVTGGAADSLPEIEVEEQAPSRAIPVEEVLEVEATVGAPSVGPPRRAIPKPASRRAALIRRLSRPDLRVAAEQSSLPPLGFVEAQELLAAINDRDDIARTVMRFASGVFKRAVLLRVQGDLALGWIGIGPGVVDRAPMLAVPLKRPSAFRLVRDAKSQFIGPLRREAPTVAFFALLGQAEPKTAVLMPILAGGEVVNILYGDNGPGELASPNVAELLILAQKVGWSYEQLVAKRRDAAARASPPVP